MHRTRNAAYGQPYRGFESLPLRHPTPLRGYGRQTTYTRSAIFTKTLTVTAEQMPLTNRNPLALFYSSFLFGNLAVPYYYVVLGILLPNPLTIMLQVFLWLAACTTLLLLTLITRTRVEQVLARRLGRIFRPLLVSAVIIAALISWQIELAISSFPLILPVEYWSSLIKISIIATAVAFLVIISAAPSRLERFLAARLSRSNKWFVANRTLGFLVLAAGLFLVGSELYQFYFLLLPTWHH
jgi:hypothetical protein